MRTRPIPAGLLVAVIASVSPASAQPAVGAVEILEPREAQIVEPPVSIILANGAAPGSEDPSQVQVTIDGRALDPDTGAFVRAGDDTFFALEPGQRLEIVVPSLAAGTHDLALAVVSPGNLDALTGESRSFTVPPPAGAAAQLGPLVVLGLIVVGFVLTRRRLMSRSGRAETT